MDVDKATGSSSEAHPIGRNQHLKRVSLLIQSKKYPGQTFVGYALLHEFNPERLSFFTAQKFPVDEELEVQVDFFGSKGHLKVRMANLHEQISSGRVMNAIPNEGNPFPVRKFYRCYAVINSLQGTLPGTASNEMPAPAASAPAEAAPAPAMPEIVAVASSEAVPAEAAAVAAEPAAGKSGDSMITSSGKPADSEDMRAKLAALSGGSGESPEEEKQAA
jgi:hypothetical protein